jgi:hypothetical protein
MNERASVDVSATYKERVRIKHLSMEPSLQGATACFQFEDRKVEIKLPTLPLEEKRYSEYAEAEADVWNSSSKEVINVHIYAVLISVLELEFQLPPAAAEHRSINASLYDEKEARELDQQSDQLYFLARRALDYWLRVVRWKTGLGLIDLDPRADGATLYGGRLFNNAHGGAFYSPLVGRTVVAPERHRLNPLVWNEIATVVAAGLNPPLWNEYLMSAHRRIEHGDLTAAIIDLAIVVESVIRRTLDAQLPADTPKWTRSMAGRTTMTDLFNRWLEFNLPTISDLPWFKVIMTLVEVRNAIMHRGNDQRLRLSFCRAAASAAEKLIVVLDASATEAASTAQPSPAPQLTLQNP